MQKDSCFLHEEKMQLFFEVTDTEVSMDLSDFSLEVQKLMDMHNSIFYVEDTCLEIQFEDVSLVKGQFYSDFRIFHLLEVDETSLGINRYVSEENHIIFESNELQQLMHKDELACDSKELLLSVEVDILEHLLNLPSHEYQKFEVPYVNFVPQDIISAIEYPLSSLSFEQREFFDVNTSHFSQVLFDSDVTSEVEPCEQMFHDATFNTFNDLIVIHELILVDDSFKSLPVPIISDHEEIFLVQMLIEEFFLKLKLQPSSTSDDIYLHWHILEEDISSHNICTSLNTFEDIETYCINTDMNSFDSQILILEFVLSDACSNKQKTGEKTEILNIERCGSLTESVCHNGIASGGTCKKIASSEALVDNKINRAHQLLESMTQLDDLDLFLNQATICVKKQNSADKKQETDCVHLVDSANNPIKTHYNSKKQDSLENDFRPRGEFHSTSVLNKSGKNSEGPLHSRRVEEKNSIKSSETTYEVPELPLSMESNKINTRMPSLPDAIVIVNTQNFKTEMVISRRSTYQKIIAMEKEGIQVVERDLNQPVDVIISAAVCLVLYDSNNIRKRTKSSDGASSLVPSCIENIAANILTSLSFAFSSCIIIFEGEVGFLGGIMESSDELYAAAASLGVDLQLFCSFSPDITDEIILNCIIQKSTRGLYPRMPESETLAESFLSKFPLLNPLSAHAILSSVGTLIEFFEMSHQQRVCALQKYLVPEASITLFSSLCRHGEREESRSGMTDCCSSVSSGHESGIFCPKSEHEPMKRKYTGSPEPKAMPMDPLKTFSSHSFWNLEDEASDDIKMSKNFSKFQRSDGRMMLNRPSLTETSFGQNKKMDMPIVDKLGSHTNKVEITDIDDDAVAGEHFSFLHPKKSPDWFSLPSFPTAAEINSDLDSWIPTKDNGQSSREGFTLNSHTSLMNNITPFKEKDPCYGRTPLSEAIYSDQPQKRSPWTKDFLNRIKEKSRMRHQSLPNISSASCFGYSGNSSKFRKRKSPSILNLYTYKNSSTVPSVEHKGQNGPTQPPNSSKAVKAAHSSSHTWTPIDKRAKRKLTFATNGSKGQSKLIWSDKTDQTLKDRL